MKMKYISICSGIEAATVAFHPLGWTPLAFAEIEPFPSAVLAHHYPSVPNYGDMTRFLEWPEDVLAECDLLVGGPPCQAFSVAGLRNSLEDDRGNLTLTYIKLIDHIDSIRRKHGREPVIAVYENVPGLLSVKDNAFGCLLSGLVGAQTVINPAGGWGNSGMVSGRGRYASWRILDAQFFGVAQRRRRIFVVSVSVGHTRGRECASSLLPLVNSMSRHFTPRREKREETAGDVGAGFEGCYGIDEECNASDDHFGPLLRGGQGGTRQAVAFQLNGDRDNPSVSVSENVAFTIPSNPMSDRGQAVCMSTGQAGAEIGIGTTLNCNHEAPIACYAVRTANTTANGHGIAEDVTHTLDQAQGQAVCYPINTMAAIGRENEKNHRQTLGIGDNGEAQFTLQSAHSHAVAFGWQNSESQGDSVNEHITPTLDKSKTPAVCYENHAQDARVKEIEIASLHAKAGTGGGNLPLCQQGPLMNVRRLTPIECSRLQGFPDDYLSQVPWRGKTPPPDGPQYKALGNSMAVPVMAYIGRNLQKAVML